MTIVSETPASSLQRQFWLLQQLQPDGTAYHVPALFHVHGALDLPALARAWSALCARHEALRTTFAQRDGALLQRVHDVLEPAFVVEQDAIDPQSSAIAAEHRARFDLERGPLARMRVWPATSGGHLVAWTLHHSVCDLATKTRLMAELAEGYAQRSVPAPAAQYARFCEHEAAYLASDAARRAQAYFEAHLGAGSEALTLPTDHARPKLQSPRGACVRFALEPALVAKLQAKSRALATKPFLLLLAGYAATLARYAQQERVVIGVPFTNRRSDVARDAVGCFVNNLPLAVDLTQAPTFDALFSQLRAAMLGHHRHQELPFERIVAQLKPVRDPSRNPLFQAGFTFEPPPQLELLGADVESLEAHAGGAQLDVFMTLWEQGDGFRGRLEYCSELFAHASMERFVRCYLTLLEHALDAQHAATAVSKLPWLSPEDREQVVHGPNRTAHVFDAPQRMEVLFLDQCLRTPEAVALGMGTRSMTYRQLCDHACALAQQLVALGVVPGDCVGLYMERSFEMVVSIYATLLAGAAYVPIDPEFPEQRIRYMLEDAAPRCILTHAAQIELPATTVPVRPVSLSASTADAAPPKLEARDPGDVAYVLFTSGSTGRPKGVRNTHAGICNRVLWMQDAYRLSARDVVLQKTPYSFDVSTWEFFWPLVVGARLEVAPPGVHRDPGALAALIQSARVTTLHFVPSMLEAFLAHPDAASCRAVSRIVCSGEALSSALVKRTTELLPAELHNLYGPTEAAVDVTAYDCRSDVQRDPVPIGKPIANVQLYVLDASRQPQPQGVVGELYIGGVQVALGYVNRPDLTQERFVPDPFSERPNARLYRTGDLARWENDGNLSFLGRIDHQVKVRGQRIELGEIEAAIGALPAVRTCVVVARTIAAASAQADTHLVAYVVFAQVETSTQALLRDVKEHLRKSLPAGMQPNYVLALDALPLTASGKVDRKLLPEPSLVSAAQSAQAASGTQAQLDTGATSALERWLSERWCELLGTTRVGIGDNLFEQGATSLMCAQLIGRIREHLGHDVPLVRLFEHPTIAQLAAHLEQAGRERVATASAGTDSALDGARTRAARQKAALGRPAPRKR